MLRYSGFPPEEEPSPEGDIAKQDIQYLSLVERQDRLSGVVYAEKIVDLKV